MSPLKQTQKIVTHTIGFNFSSDWLREVAEAGGGTFTEASSAEDLVDAIYKPVRGERPLWDFPSGLA